MKCKTGIYPWRFDPELQKWRFYEPDEPLPSERKDGKSAAVHTFKAGFDHGLGAYVSSKNDVKERIKRINEATGSNLIEVGNERASGKQITRKYDKQAMSEYMQHMRNQRT